MTVQHLAYQLTLGGLLDELRRLAGHYEATNCNGGVKEVLCFAQVPDRLALWHRRCPDNPEFIGETIEPLASSRTLHWFDPCELLKSDARSEYRPELRERQQGGGWQMKSCGASSCELHPAADRRAVQRRPSILASSGAVQAAPARGPSAGKSALRNSIAGGSRPATSFSGSPIRYEQIASIRGSTASYGSSSRYVQA